MKPDSQMTLDRYFRQCVGIDVSKDKFTACLQMYDRASDVGCHTTRLPQRRNPALYPHER